MSSESDNSALWDPGWVGLPTDQFIAKAKAFLQEVRAQGARAEAEAADTIESAAKLAEGLRPIKFGLLDELVEFAPGKTPTYEFSGPPGPLLFMGPKSLLVQSGWQIMHNNREYGAPYPHASREYAADRARLLKAMLGGEFAVAPIYRGPPEKV